MSKALTPMKLAENILHFGRLLRRAGLPVGPSDIVDAARALTAVDLSLRGEVRAALLATMTHRREDQEVFDFAFRVFWRDPEAARHAQALAMIDGGIKQERVKASVAQRRITEAYAPPKKAPPPPEEDEEIQIDAVLTASDAERLQTMDFEAMGADEIAQAKDQLRRLRFVFDTRRTRRHRPAATGRVDLRRTLAAARRNGGQIARIVHTRPREEVPPLVVLCDISGSMARYAPLFVHFLHAATAGFDHAEMFLFGTRLTNVTKYLRHKDPEAAFEAVAGAVPDWSGGTRIGTTIDRFNRDWGRRLLARGATVLLITDGLERDETVTLADAMARLHRTARRLIWLNPLLRWSGFEPKSAGARAMLPHVDEFRPVHNLASLRDLVAALERPARARERISA